MLSPTACSLPASAWRPSRRWNSTASPTSELRSTSEGSPRGLGGPVRPKVGSPRTDRRGLAVASPCRSPRPPWSPASVPNGRPSDWPSGTRPACSSTRPSQNSAEPKSGTGTGPRKPEEDVRPETGRKRCGALSNPDRRVTVVFDRVRHGQPVREPRRAGSPPSAGALAGRTRRPHRGGRGPAGGFNRRGLAFAGRPQACVPDSRPRRGPEPRDEVVNLASTRRLNRLAAWFTTFLTGSGWRPGPTSSVSP